MPITFSEQFNISKEVLEITGVFDVILDIDTRVFIDPALLELCTEPEFLDARKKVEKYFSDIITLLRHSKSQTDMYRKRAERMLTFTELSGTCFGYSQNGTGGNAIGSVLRKTILNTIQDLMTEGDTDPVLFELLGVFQEGIGCDRVSDALGLDQYTWNEVPNSHQVKDRADKLKRAGLWQKVRDRYLEKKNMYLFRPDHNHPSFVVYVEAVNEVYSRYFNRGGGYSVQSIF